MKVVLTYFVLSALSFFAAVSPFTSPVTSPSTSPVTAAMPPVTTQPTHTKASKYLTDKWEKWFFLEDFDHDGELSVYDENEKFKMLIGKVEIDDGQEGAMYEMRELLWKKTILDDRLEVSKDEFVEIMKTRYEFNKTDFIQTFKMFDYFWLHVIDINFDGFLTKDEFLIDRTVSEYKDKLKDEEFFDSHKLVNGTIFIPDAVNVWLRFQTEGDPSKPDIMRDAILSNFTTTTK